MGCVESFNEEIYIQAHEKSIVISNKIQKSKIPKLKENIQIINQPIDQTQIKLIIDILKNHFLFSSMNQQSVNSIAQRFKKCTCKMNSYIFKQQDPAHLFFIIKQGKMQIQVNQQPVKTIENSQAFGQLALLYNALRSSSIKVLSENSLLLCLQFRQFKKALDLIHKNTIEQIKELVENVNIFKYLTSRQRFGLLSSLTKLKYSKKQIIFNKNDHANCLYIVNRGLVKISIPDKNQILVRKYQYFGEGALLYSNSQTRSGVAQAEQQQTICFSLNYNVMKEVLGSNINNLLYYNMMRWALKRSQCFMQASQKVISELINILSVQKTQKGQIIKNKFEKISKIIIPLDCKFNNSDQVKAYGLQQFQSNFSNLNYYELKTTSEGFYATVCLDIIKGFLELNAIKTGQSLKSIRCIKGIKTTHVIDVSIANFIQKEKLGQGQFGSIYLAIDKKFGTQFAVKVMSKKKIKEQHLMQSVYREKCFLQELNSPFIGSFYKAQQDKDNIYLIIQYIKGVQLFDILRQIGIIPQNVSKYYIGSLVLALQELHNNSIMYRDIKPENTIITNEGRVMLIDLGAAKKLNAQNQFRTFTLIGTPNYMAPQMTQAKGYSFQIDYWAIGVMLYEFICGVLPFGEKMNDPYNIFSDIRSRKHKYPLKMNRLKHKDAMELIDSLLVKDPKLRLQNGLIDIKISKYFKDFEWYSLMNNQMKSPYIPKKFRKENNQNYEKRHGKVFKFDQNSLKQWDYDFINQKQIK